MAAKILVVDDEPNLLRIMVYTLANEGYEVISAETGPAALQAVATARPDLMLLDVVLPGMSGIDVCKRVRSSPDTATMPIIMVSARAQVADKIRGLEAGADEYVTKPVDSDEIVARVAALLRGRVWSVSQAGSPDKPSKGLILAVYGPKGGVGRTVIAVNLATALVKMTGKLVILVDGNAQLGDVALALGVQSSHDILDLLSRSDDLDTDLINRIVVSHASGLSILPASAKIEHNDVMQAEPLVRVLSRLQEMFDYIVVDASTLLDDHTLAILDIADRIVLVTTAGLLSLRNTKAFLDLAEELGFAQDTLLVVLNRYEKAGEIKCETIEKALRCKLAARIPSDAAGVDRSLDVGVPLVMSHPAGPVAQSIFQLAKLIAAVGGGSCHTPASSRWRNLLGTVFTS